MNNFIIEEIYSSLTKKNFELFYLNSKGKSIPIKEQFLSGSKPRVILSGSFNPIHSAHIELVRIASKIVKKPILFELSIKNQEPSKGLFCGWIRYCNENFRYELLFRQIREIYNKNIVCNKEKQL